jgi:molybdopterin-containing oxidoreductase family iron-sulfur binding subunit
MTKHLPVINKGDEFPSDAAEIDEPSRRSFIQLMGASLALAGMTGCRRPAEQILPYGRAPEEIVPGRPQRFASAFAFAGSALGVVVESHEGRPTKIEGNPLHPESRGGAHAFAQASVLDLYDPDRSRTPLHSGEARSWDEAFAFLRAQAGKLGDGHGLAILTEAHRSPTLKAQIELVRRRFPRARVVRYEPFSRTAARQGAEIAFGRPLEPVFAVERARVIATVDCDLLQSVKHARAFADGRRSAPANNRLYAIESSFTITGASADHRLRTQSRRAHAIALELARALDVDGLPPARTLHADEQRFVSALAHDLRAQGGMLVAGELQPAVVHALTHLINARVAGDAVHYVAPFSSDPEGPRAMVELAAAMKRGDLSLLLILGGNPVYDAPADADFANALSRVPASVHLSAHVDETSALATWHLNRAHWLESWGDVRAEDGTLSIVQPLIAPLHGGRTDAEVLERLLGGERSAYQLVQANFLAPTAMRRALHDGLVADSAWAAETATVQASALTAPAADEADLEVTFRPDAHAYDGRFANNGWLHELPHPFTKLTWDNAALIAPATAHRLGLSDGDIVELRVGERRLHIPVLAAPGQAEESIALSVGLGRRRAGKVGTGVGFDVNPVRASDSFGIARARLSPTGGKHRLAITHGHHSMEGRPLIRQGEQEREAEEPSLWQEHRYDGHKWGMVIDLQACIGCNACTVACQAENNIPLVGKEGVLRSREMHWLRIDRYFSDSDDPEAFAQPIACQQCEMAPCEQVCPVAATTHSPEGLNDMAYNRCIGTRYCANNCPYKVRRFNFFNYNRDVDELRRMQLNPDVTVRTRGVMEKCTYCVQRINAAKIAAHVAGHERVADGQVVTACQQTCPTQAISFGDLNDATSAVARRAADARNYVLLGELNLRPRTSFLSRVRNPNPELA